MGMPAVQLDQLVQTLCKEMRARPDFYGPAAKARCFFCVTVSEHRTLLDRHHGRAFPGSHRQLR